MSKKKFTWRDLSLSDFRVYLFSLFKAFIPKKKIRKNGKGKTVIGQRQKWFLLSFNNDSELISLDQSAEQEFDSWKWIDPEKSINQVVGFKKEVYRQVIDEFISFI